MYLNCISIWLDLGRQHSSEICNCWTIYRVRDDEVFVGKNVSKLSLTLSPTASLTIGTSTFICPLVLRRLLDDAISSFVDSSGMSSPRSSAFVVVGPVERREVDTPFVGKLGSGKLLGGREVARNAGEEL